MSPRKIQGQSNTVLSETGKLQARAIGNRLKKEKIHALYSSDLTRAIEVRDHHCR